MYHTPSNNTQKLVFGCLKNHFLWERRSFRTLHAIVVLYFSTFLFLLLLLSHRCLNRCVDISCLAPANNRKQGASLSSPSKSKRVATATATSSAKKSLPQSKKAATKSLSSLGFFSSKQPAVPIGTTVLLNDSIYPRGQCPPGVKEHMFVYEVVQWNQNSTIAKVQYINQVICQGGNKY
jgi:hypothetical protein